MNLVIHSSQHTLLLNLLSIFFSVGLILTASAAIYHDFINRCNISYIINKYYSIIIFIILISYTTIAAEECLFKNCTLFKMQGFSPCYYRRYYDNTIEI